MIKCSIRSPILVIFRYLGQIGCWKVPIKGVNALITAQINFSDSQNIKYWYRSLKSKKRMIYWRFWSSIIVIFNIYAKYAANRCQLRALMLKFTAQIDFSFSYNTESWYRSLKVRRKWLNVDFGKGVFASISICSKIENYLY